MSLAQTKFTVSGRAFGCDIDVKVRVTAAEADAVAEEHNIAIADVQNVQTMFVSTLAKTLAQLEMLEELGQHPFRKSPEQAPVVHVKDFMDSLAKAKDGKGD